MNIEPDKWTNGLGKVRWQPRINAERACTEDLETWWSFNPGESRMLLTSRRRALRIARREVKRRASATWTAGAEVTR